MARIFVGTSTLSRTFVDESSAPDDPTTVTCTVTADDGTAVTLGALTNPSTGVYRRTVTVGRPTLLTVTWTADTIDYVDLVDVHAAPYVSVAELSATDTTLASKTTPVLAEGIEDAEAECAELTGVAWRRRYSVETLAVQHDGTVRLRPYAARVGNVTVDGTALASTGYLLRAGGVLDLYGAACPWSIVTVGYEHGQIQPTREIRRAVLIRAGQFVRSPTSAVSMFSERVTFGDSGSTVRLLPKSNATGVAEVDAIYGRHAYAGGVGIA